MHPNTNQFRELTLDQVMFISVNFKITSIATGPRPDSVLIHLHGTGSRGNPEAVVLRESCNTGLMGIRLVYSNAYFISLLDESGYGFKE
jgi:hypothetical protein